MQKIESLSPVAGPPVVTLVVASHGRSLRLRWLLNALEEQTLPRDRWELVLVHDYDAATAERFISSHPLARDGTLRELAIEPGTGSPARQRNLGWRRARAALVAFTDDDCRPEPGWLAALVDEAARRPGQVVQGLTRPDPLEFAVFAAPHVRTLDVEPPNRFAQTANILYPRVLLEQLDGFDERAVAGEDVDLSLRAKARGVALVGAPEAVVNHAVESLTLPDTIRAGWKWHYLAYVVKRHPELRRNCSLGIFWRHDHLELLLALAGAMGARRQPALALLAVPWVRRESRQRGPRGVDRLVALVEMPGRAARGMAEIAIMAAGSVRFRTLLL